MKPKIYTICLMAATSSLFSCVNNDYDLSDIDSNVSFKINNLVVPINMEPITLKSMLDLKDDSQIQEINGEYAVVEEGDFSSEAIKIKSFSAAGPHIEPISDVLTQVAISSPIAGPKKSPAFSVSYPISHKEIEFNYSANNVDDAVVTIDNIYTDFGFKVSLSFTGLDGVVNTYSIANLQLQLPKGLINVTCEQGSYDRSTGVFTARDTTVRVDKSYTLDLQCGGLNFKESGAVLAHNTFSFSDQIFVKEGKLILNNTDLQDDLNFTNIPERITYHCSADMKDIAVTAFDGMVHYDIDGINVDPVSMKNIPDVLNQTGTSIVLDNPQIYFSINNPIQDDKLKASTRIKLAANRVGSAPKEIKLDNDSIVIGYDHSDANYQYCLSPKNPDNYYKGFANSQHEKFSELSNLLEGEKLPESIDITVEEPRIWNQQVTNFKLGRTFNALKGKYAFYAPLVLSDRSNVIYSDVFDGWNDEDLDCITISKLEITANIDSDIPMGLVFTGCPIDKKGNELTNVQIKNAKINANAKNQPIHITMEGEIKNLDGIRIKATGSVAEGNSTSLKPGQTIRLSNLKAVVAGDYQKKL